MGYSYYFTISLVKIPDELEDEKNERIFIQYIKNIKKECERLHKEDFWFPEIGVKEISSSGGYGTGEQKNLIPNLIKLSLLFPTTTFGFFHFYWDSKSLNIYTLLNGELIETDSHDGDKLFTLGSHSFYPVFDVENTIIENNILDLILFDRIEKEKKI